MKTMERTRVSEPRTNVIPPVVRNHRAISAFFGALVLVVVAVAILRSGEEAVVENPAASQTLAGVVVPSQSSPIVLNQAQIADAARWTALAESYAVREQLANPYSLTQGQLADAARLTSLAQALTRPEGLTQGQQADAARWTALAEAYGFDLGD